MMVSTAQDPSAFQSMQPGMDQVTYNGYYPSQDNTWPVYTAVPQQTGYYAQEIPDMTMPPQVNYINRQDAHTIQEQHTSTAAMDAQPDTHHCC